MKKQILFAVLMLSALLAIAMPAKAQNAPGQIISVNEPISTELRASLEAWLTNPPSSAVYYAVTFSQPIGLDWYVSLVGLNIANPDDPWSLVGDEFGNQQVIWMDTIRIASDGTVTFPFAQPEMSGAFKIAAPIYAPTLGAGGGSYVRFPWQPSKAVQFGILGVHASQFQLNGNAVDLVSGSDMGSAAANDWVYNSVEGDITYICNYGDTVAVRVVGNGDSLLYAHLLPNDNLVLDHSFQAGDRMGRLKHGTFTDECGNAFQQDDHWHLHWGFLMSSGKFQAEGCILTGNGPTSKWKCGTTETRPLGFLYHYGNVGINPETGTVGTHDGTGAGGGPSFWEYFLEGIVGVMDALFMKSLPDHDTNLTQLFNGLLTSIKVVFRIAYMLMRGNLNIAPTVLFVGIGIAFTLSIRLVTFVLMIIRFIKGLPLVV